MRDDQDTDTSLNVYATGWMRAGAVCGLLAGVLLIAVPSTFRSPIIEPLKIACGSFMLLYNGWLAFNAWRRPVLHLGSHEIRWSHPAAPSPRVIPTAAVTGYRWPNPMDLWLDRNDGPPEPIRLAGVGRKNKERVRAWLSARIPPVEAQRRSVRGGSREGVSSE